MEQHLQRYLDALAAQQERSTQRIGTLEAEGRQDEADLEKVRRNVWGIFETLAKTDAAAARQEAQPAIAFVTRYSQRLEQFPEPWRKRLAMASAHGDVIAQTIEETKLRTVAQISELFLETEGKP